MTFYKIHATPTFVLLSLLCHMLLPLAPPTGVLDRGYAPFHHAGQY